MPASILSHGQSDHRNIKHSYRHDPKGGYWRKEPFDLVFPAVFVRLTVTLILWDVFSMVLPSTLHTPSSGTLKCDANNNVLLQDSPNLWDAKYFLSVTMGLGEFQFSTVKGIDIAWDLVVGCCGQALAALLATRVFGQTLLVSTEHHAVTYESITSISFAPVTITVT